MGFPDRLVLRVDRTHLRFEWTQVLPEQLREPLSEPAHSAGDELVQWKSSQSRGCHGARKGDPWREGVASRYWPTTVSENISPSPSAP